MHAVDQKSLNDAAWKACDTFRGVVDPAQYKDYILIFLFWKYVSDLWLDHKAAYERESGGDAERVARKLRLERFNLTEETTFQAIYHQRNADNVGELIDIALHSIEDANRGKLHRVLTIVGFNSTDNLGETADRNRRLKNLFEDFAKPELDFSPSRFEGEHKAEDAIGETYIYLISQFASDAGKKAGEFFTPRRVSELLVRLADPQPGSRICDPACGSATLLVRAAEHIAAIQGVETARADVKLFGQEATRQTQGLARMNMFLHGLDDARIEWGDTLNNPKLVTGGNKSSPNLAATADTDLMRFDLVVANPPFSLDKWGADKAVNDRWHRFERGVPPKGRGDYAFISHMVSTAMPTRGRVAVIAPHGVLFRSGAEGRIREALIEENLLDGVVGLPAQLFPSTGIPVVLLIFDRAREKGGARADVDDVLFIDASRDFVPGKKQNQLSPEQLDRIVAAWRAREAVERYVAVVPRAQLKENGYNLNIPRYVDTFEAEEEIDVAAVQREIEALEAQLATTRAKMDGYLRELGVSW